MKRRWRASRSTWPWISFFVTVLVLLLVAWKTLPVTDWLRTGVLFVEDLGPWGMLVWLALFTGLATITFPTTPLYLASGVLFGLAWGALIGFAGGLAASSVSFVIARHFTKGTWEKKLEESSNFKELREAVNEDGFKIVLLARLSPFIPASIKNYGLALTSISVGRYAAATALAQVPVAATYAYLGWVGGAAALDGKHEMTQLEITLFVAGAAASILVLGLFAWKADRFLKRRKSS